LAVWPYLLNRLAGSAAGKQAPSGKQPFLAIAFSPQAWPSNSGSQQQQQRYSISGIATTAAHPTAQLSSRFILESFVGQINDDELQCIAMIHKCPVSAHRRVESPDCRVVFIDVCSVRSGLVGRRALLLSLQDIPRALSVAPSNVRFALRFPSLQSTRHRNRHSLRRWSKLIPGG